MLPDDEPKELTDPPKAGRSQINVITQDAPKSKLDANLKPPTFIAAKWLNILTNPSVATFASEIPAASWGTTLLGVAIFAVFYSIMLITGVVPPQATLLGGTNSSVSLQTSIIYGFIINVISLLIVAWLIYALAKSTGIRRGDFATHTYLYSLYAVPIAMIAHLLGSIPGFGEWGHGYVALLAPVVYGLFLTYYMVQALYGLKRERARWLLIFTFLGSIVIFYIIIILLFYLLLVVF